MKPATYEFLRQRFSAYYNGEVQGAGAVYIPEALTEREWGFIFFSSGSKTAGMRRHLSFSSPEDVHTYLKTMIPAHVYYSTAYYARPGAGQMSDKGWLGADLIFDLDADHIVRGPYDVMLARVKEELFKLIDMLTSELGFFERDLRINFSGGRGYHIHIPTLAVRSWDSTERRELVNYVSGTGLSAESMLTGPARNKGWQKRYRAALLAELDRIAALESDAQAEYLTGLKGISDKFATGFLKNLDATRTTAATIPEKLLENKVIRAITNPENKPFQDQILAMAAQADEPVTTDIKRLIRHPGSLHGGSGMRVTPLEVDRLDAFDPLLDAVVFGERQVTVECSFPLTMPILGNSYSLSKGLNTVPEALAVFLCCRGIAEIGGV
ncbi:MAG TPA: DNA primase catalytic subunit PriS [Methanocorpusculum sp.]|nr:DNA primase catalytic subunit PriS [Candidatus Methanocorpusculum faecipullorum]HJK47252.1 DNA primase catalytic subunit PriS [Methanocorpusculum sp.]HJK50399.1 DNA primase catalytic subunit PriS [Methanocorpusculum sp.]HJK53385.1 DNA primase catalytic subunit PriS [Methanocorpusculum sp.]HJK54433.1 DNA primase catalytic subunit PriS [Methanocorpusculum sp.]